MTASREFFRVSVKQLTLREEPTVLADILDRIERGGIIEKYGVNEKGDWIRTKHNDKEGWLYRRCMKQTEPPWFTIARNELGVQEYPGAANNPRVVEYLHTTTNISEALRSQDETPWCSGFVNWCMMQAGRDRTKSALARSWQGWGEHINEPYIGCVVVFQRAVNFGHVGFYLEETETHIKVLGGNQQNPQTGIFEVSEKSYPKTDFLEYRAPTQK
ncbi:MAG: TIGR02594 family protein [Anaerolineaceae bacterium]|nr:MAG: TIGR02594 family protein [Anaerolineaceae bacterium]